MALTGSFLFLNTTSSTLTVLQPDGRTTPDIFNPAFIQDNDDIDITDDDYEAHSEIPGLIPDGAMIFISLYLTIVIPALISIFGTITNFINLIVFTRMGLKDGMSIGLWALAFSDFCVTSHTLASSACFLAEFIAPDALIDGNMVQYVSFLWSQDLMYLISNWTTTFISLERCVCVVAPFKVKSIFTKTRSIVVISLIYLFHFASYAPIFASHWLTYTSVSGLSNVTEQERVMIIDFSWNRLAIHHTVDIIHGAVLPVIQQTIVIVSTICLAYGLKASSKVRLTNTESKEGSKKQSQLSSRETRLVKVTVFLAVILTLCNIPRFVAVYCTLLISEMHVGDAYENTYILLWALTSMFASLNASVNIFVYLLVNVNYRTVFLNLCCTSSSKGKAVTSERETVTKTSIRTVT